jgi:hypothetical protein
VSEQRALRVLLAVDGSAHSDAAVDLVAGIGWPPGTPTLVAAAVAERWSLLGLSSEIQSVVAESWAGIHRVNRAAAEDCVAQAAKKLHACGLTFWKRKSTTDGPRRCFWSGLLAGPPI